MAKWWSDSWNPMTGCTRCSEACRLCWAKWYVETRLCKLWPDKYASGFKPTFHGWCLDDKHHPAKGLIFVCDVSDLFHEEFSDDQICAVFEVMERNPRHRYALLTKRSQRMSDLAERLPHLHNVYWGVTVELPRHYNRIADLRRVPAPIRYLSCEPLLGRLPDLPLEGIDWVVVGGESCQESEDFAMVREMKLEWAAEIRDRCRAQGVAYFHKQMGSHWAGKVDEGADPRKWAGGLAAWPRDPMPVPDTDRLIRWLTDCGLRRTDICEALSVGPNRVSAVQHGAVGNTSVVGRVEDLERRVLELESRLAGFEAIASASSAAT